MDIEIVYLEIYFVRIKNLERKIRMEEKNIREILKNEIICYIGPLKRCKFYQDIYYYNSSKYSTPDSIPCCKLRDKKIINLFCPFSDLIKIKLEGTYDFPFREVLWK